MRFFNRLAKQQSHASDKVIIVERQSPDWWALARGAPHDTAAFDQLLGEEAGFTEQLITYWNT